MLVPEGTVPTVPIENVCGVGVVLPATWVTAAMQLSDHVYARRNPVKIGAHKRLLPSENEIPKAGGVLERELDDLRLHGQHGVEQCEFVLKDAQVCVAILVGIDRIDHRLTKLLDAPAAFDHSLCVKDQVLGVDELEPVAGDVHPHGR